MADAKERETRYYRVKARRVKEGAAEADIVDHLVEATSKAAAYAHVCETYVGEVTLATGKEIAELVGRGVKPEKAEGGE